MFEEDEEEERKTWMRKNKKRGVREEECRVGCWNGRKTGTKEEVKRFPLQNYTPRIQRKLESCALLPVEGWRTRGNLRV